MSRPPSGGAPRGLYGLARPLLFRLDAEDAHHLTLRGLGVARGAARALAPVRPDPILAQTLWGLSFASPIGLAAGLDKNAEAVEALGALGFGFLEVGTVTPRPQAGNPRPRLFRLPEDAALINRMGFNNAGAEKMAERLARVRRAVPVAVNVGRNKDTPNERAADDYRACVGALAEHADLFVVNISSPNTPGLRGLQHGDELRDLLAGIREETERARVRTLRPARPFLVKIAPDLSPAEVESTVEIVLASGAAGLVVSNTTLARDGLTHEKRGEAGGLSGRPLTERSTALVRDVARLTCGRLPIVASGGVFTPRDAYDKIRAGASLVEVYTALVYEGPTLPGRLARGLADLLRRDGFANVADAVGADLQAR